LKTYVPAAFLALAALLGITATRRDLSRPNVRIFPEMADSPAYQSLSPNPVLPGGRTLQPPPAGTIPRGFEPFRYVDSPEDRKRAGRELRNPQAPTSIALQEGRHVFENYCVHCHGPAGKGDGPVARAVPTLSMPVSGKATLDLPDGEIFHIITYGRNNMPGHATQIRAADRWKVVHHLREMQRAEMDRLRRAGLAYEGQEDPRPLGLVSTEYGQEVFRGNCASCHGEEGRVPQRGVPTLNQPRVLAIADDDYYADIITHGRKGSAMIAWDAVLTPTQIRSLVLYIRSWQPHETDTSRVASIKGDARRGKSLFRGNCAACHGTNGQGGIGNSLRTPSFLALASDSFLRDTITLGRKHTAMPAGSTLDTEEVADILAFIRSWSPRKHTFKDVEAALPEGDAKIGKKVFASYCAGCHGTKGEGGIGSRLNSQTFLALADDTYLYRAIAEGRPDTAMPAWSFLQARDVADIMTFMRTWQKAPSEKPSRARRGGGKAEFGEVLYRQSCMGCHGAEGEGGVGAQLANPVFLDSVSDEFLYKTIAYGKPDTAMRAFLKDGAGGALTALSTQDIDHLIAYLRSWQLRTRVYPLRRPWYSTSIARGKLVFEELAGCMKCHGKQGEGATGPALGNPEFLRVASDGYLIGTVILGRDGTEMRPFTKAGAVALSQEEVEDVVAYLRSFEHRPMTANRMVDRSPSSIAEGRDLFLANCAGCHGSEGLGPAPGQAMPGYAPSINNPQFLGAASDSFLLATIAIGRPGTPMRAFSKGSGGITDLTADEIKKIVAYLRSWEEEYKR